MSKRVKFANSTLISGIIICIGIILYGLTRSELHTVAGINKFYILSVIVIAVLVVVLYKCKDEVKVRIVLLFFSVGISIYMAESLLMIYEWAVSSKTDQVWLQDRELNLLKERGVTVDTRSKFQLMMDLRAEGVDAFPQFNAYGRIGSNGLDFEGHKIFPLGSISNKTTVYCREQGQYIIYDTDEHGFRNPKGLYNKNNVDMVLIGDSFAQGMCVKQEDDTAGWLRKKGHRVLNLGMGSNGPLIELATLSEYADHIQPKFIFWMWFEGNDLINLENEKKSTILMQYLDGNFSQNLFQRQQVIDKAIIADLEHIIAELEKKTAENRVENNKPEFNVSFSKIATLSHIRHRLDLSAKCSSDIDPLLKRVIESFKTRVQGWNGELYFIYMPASDRYEDKMNSCVKKRLNGERKQVLAMVRD